MTGNEMKWRKRWLELLDTVRRDAEHSHAEYPGEAESDLGDFEAEHLEQFLRGEPTAAIAMFARTLTSDEVRWATEDIGHYFPMDSVRELLLVLCWLAGRQLLADIRTPHRG